MPQADIEEQFSLKWNDFQNNLTIGFQHLLEEELMLDVSLSAGGQLIQAHKIILSICSPYFKALFQTNPCKHPVIILKDVGAEELLDVLDFMYRGEASVKKENLAAFLRLAENLKVKGLADYQEDEEDDNEEECKETYRKVPMKKKMRLSDSSNSERVKDGDDFCGSGPPKKRKKKLISKTLESTVTNDVKNKTKINEGEAAPAAIRNEKTEEISAKSDEKNHVNNLDSTINMDNDDDDFDDNMDDFGAGPSTSDENTDNLPSDFRRAAIWDYFDENKMDETVRCKICSKVFSNKKKWGTANMKRHMKLHPVENSQLRAYMQQELENRTTASFRLAQLLLNQ